MADREIGTQRERLLDLDDGFVLPPAQPQRTAHRPVCGRVAIVGDEALAGGVERPGDLRIPIRYPMQESVLEMSERQAGVGARERAVWRRALWKKCAARSLSSPLKRYMCHRPR